MDTLNEQWVIEGIREEMNNFLASNESEKHNFLGTFGM